MKPAATSENRCGSRALMMEADILSPMSEHQVIPVCGQGIHGFFSRPKSSRRSPRSMPSSWWIRMPAAAVSLLDCPCRYRALSKAVGLSGGGDRCGGGGGAGGRGRGFGGETDSCSGGGGLGEPRSSPLETPCGTARGMCGDDGCRGLTTNADGGGDANGCELRRSSTAKEHRATKTSKTSLPVRDSAKAFNAAMGELRARVNASWTARLRERRRRCNGPGESCRSNSAIRAPLPGGLSSEPSAAHSPAD